jgi:hypothetical protein
MKREPEIKESFSSSTFVDPYHDCLRVKSLKFTSDILFILQPSYQLTPVSPYHSWRLRRRLRLGPLMLRLKSGNMVHLLWQPFFLS